MIYQKCIRFQRRGVTRLRVLAAERALDRQRQRLALFVDQTDFGTSEARIAAIDAERASWWQHMRDMRASRWRRYRRHVERLPIGEQRALRASWATSPYPKSSEYFAEFVAEWFRKSGRII